MGFTVRPAVWLYCQCAHVVDECMLKYGNPSVWKACCTVFDHLNLAAVRLRSYFCWATANGQIVDDSILCVHGGLSPDIRTLDQVRIIPRAQEVPHEGAFCGMFLPPLAVHTLIYRLDVVRSRRRRGVGSQSERGRMAIRRPSHRRGQSPI